MENLGLYDGGGFTQAKFPIESSGASVLLSAYFLYFWIEMFNIFLIFIKLSLIFLIYKLLVSLFSNKDENHN